MDAPEPQPSSRYQGPPQWHGVRRGVARPREPTPASTRPGSPIQSRQADERRNHDRVATDLAPSLCERCVVAAPGLGGAASSQGLLSRERSKQQGNRSCRAFPAGPFAQASTAGELCRRAAQVSGGAAERPGKVWRRRCERVVGRKLEAGVLVVAEPRSWVWFHRRS